MKKVIVITGGNSGLGKETAKMLSGENLVVILGKNKDEVGTVAREIGCEGIICDITNIEEVKSAYSEIMKNHGKVDCLINCAGVWIEGPIDVNDPEKIKNTILVNTFGTILMTNIFVSDMKKNRSGRIINVSSQAGLNFKAERSVYNASKWAVTGFTKCLQPELSPFGVSVVGFYPGFIHTELFGKGSDAIRDFSTAMSVEKVSKEIKYLVDVDNDIVIKEFGLQSIKQI